MRNLAREDFVFSGEGCRGGGGDFLLIAAEGAGNVRFRGTEGAEDDAGHRRGSE